MYYSAIKGSGLPSKPLWKTHGFAATHPQTALSFHASAVPCSTWHVGNVGKISLPKTNLLGGWTNPIEKYARQIGSFPQVRVKIKKYLKPPPSNSKSTWKSGAPWKFGDSELGNHHF